MKSFRGDKVVAPFLFLEWMPGTASACVAATHTFLWATLHLLLAYILHFTSPCANTFLVLGIYICKKRTRTTQNLSPWEGIWPLHCTAIVQCTELLKRMAKSSLESRTQLRKIHQKSMCLLVWNKSCFKIDQLSASEDCAFYLSSEYFRKNKPC